MAASTATKTTKKVGGKAAKPAAVAHKFVIDFSGPAKDKIFDATAFEKFLIEHIKVDGKTGQLGQDVTISKETEGQLTVSASVPFSKRYLKYLVKRFLKRNLMREWLRVISTGPNTYALKFYNVSFDNAEDEDEE